MWGGGGWAGWAGLCGSDFWIFFQNCGLFFEFFFKIAVCFLKFFLKLRADFEFFFKTASRFFLFLKSAEIGGVARFFAFEKNCVFFLKFISKWWRRFAVWPGLAWLGRPCGPAGLAGWVGRFVRLAWAGLAGPCSLLGRLPRCLFVSARRWRRCGGARGV